MKQILQNYRSGEITLAEVPLPRCAPNSILVRNAFSLISTGTERSIVSLGKKSLLGKAKARPDLVKKVIDKAKKEGVLKTFQEAMGRLDVPTPLGYSSSGTVVAIGSEVTEFSLGDRVACVGQGFASHAEYIAVPKQLVSKLPEDLELECAAFGMLGAIAMHGLRSANLSFGSRVLVLGLGLLGLITVQILKAYGCQVLAFDPIKQKVEMAQNLGVFATEDPELLQAKIAEFTDDLGVDATILTLATDKKEPLDAAIEMTRFRGKIVVVGVVDIHPDRNSLWHKEIELVVSKAAGPGSLEPSYELDGIDYPLSYVRWTEQRNLQEFLRLMAQKLVRVDFLITHRYELNQAEQVYSDLVANTKADLIAGLFCYAKEPANSARKVSLADFKPSKIAQAVKVGVLGSGLFARALLLPALKKIKGLELRALVAATGASAWHNAKKARMAYCATHEDEVLKDHLIDAIIAATPHHTHARLIKKAIENQKAIFVEKPLCVNQTEFLDLAELLQANPNVLVQVGHNRRFSPHALRIKEWLAGRVNPLVLSMRINAGFVPKTHWVHSAAQGGSRIIGEMTHFFDLMNYWVESEPQEIFARRVQGNDSSIVNNDNLLISISYKDGSIAELVYAAMGNKQYTRERSELFFDGVTLVLDDFKKSFRYAKGRCEKYKTFNQQMGYQQELEHFFAVLRGEAKALSLVNLLMPMQMAFAVQQALQTGQPVQIQCLSRHPCFRGVVV